MFGRLRVIILAIGLLLTANAAQATPINFVTNVNYNPHGQIIKIEYGNGTVTNYTYHSLNLRLQRIHTVNSSTQALQDLNYTYDSAGNILSITDAVNTATQTFQYDALNRLTQAVGALYGTKTFAYDQIGNILQKDGLNYAYGENGAGPHAVTSLSNGTTYQYDLNGNMIKKTKPAEITDYTYDVENRLVNVKKNTTLVAEYFYDGDGGRVGKIDYTQTGQSGTCFLAGTQILMADGSARPIEKLAIGDEVIGFDEKSMKKVPVKVTQVFNQETAYDYLLINGHMKVTPNHKVYTEDAWKEIGNMKLGDKLLFADLGEHTIKSFEKIRSNEGVKVYNIEVEGVHNYFANGYLVHNKMVFGSQTTGKVTKYLGSLYENVDGQEVRYIYLGSTRVASINAGKIYYYHDDHLGGTNVLSNNLGAKTELIEYLPFGGYAKREKYGSSAEVAYYYFTGKPLDDETGLYYFGARYYDPQLGRFITADTIVQNPYDPQTLNRYSYTSNNPVNRIDADGHKWSWKKFWNSFIGAAVGAIVTVATGGLGAPIAFALGGAVGGAITGGLDGGWKGALMGAAFGGVLGGGVGLGIAKWGASFGYAALVAGGGYAIGTGNADSFLGGVAGGIVGTGIGSFAFDGISNQNPDNGGIRSDTNANYNENWEILGAGTTDGTALAHANANQSSVFFVKSRGILSDIVRAGMEKVGVFGRSLAQRQMGSYLRGASGKYIFAHSEGTLLLAGAAKSLSVDGVKLSGATFSWNAPVIMQSTATNIAHSIGVFNSNYNLNWNDPIGVFTTFNPFKTITYGVAGVGTLATQHGGKYYNNQ